MTLRAVIVDDEPLARTRLRSLLAASRTGVAIIAEAENARAAAELIEQLHPDLLFMDIQMPEENGLEMLRALEPADRPAIIFTTAHPEYAVDAFDLSAADYVVKPFDAERVARATERARRFIAGGRATARPTGTLRRERFAVRVRDEIIFVKATDIDWIGAEGNYVRLYAGTRSYLLRESMQGVDEALDPASFIRVHRSAIVNLDRVCKLITSPDGIPAIVLSTGANIPLGPSYRGRLEEALGQKL